MYKFVIDALDKNGKKKRTELLYPNKSSIEVWKIFEHKYPDLKVTSIAILKSGILYADEHDPPLWIPLTERI